MSNSNENLAALETHYIEQGQQRIRRQLELICYFESKGFEPEAKIANRLLNTMQMSMAIARNQLRHVLEKRHGSTIEAEADNMDRADGRVPIVHRVRSRRRVHRPRSRRRIPMPQQRL